MKKYLEYTIYQLHQAYLNKEVTPLEVIKEVIAALKEDKNNAIEYLMEKEALEKASKLVDCPSDNYFWGIPFAIKDNFSTKDVPTTGGSNILNGYIPLYNATVVLKLYDLNAIPVCKATLDELAMGGSGTSGHLGPTFNPYDNTHQHLIGGSSSGSAALVAAAIVPFSLGSDTGDSIRKPASYSALVGYKPTWSLISRYGLFPFAPSLDTVGFFTRSVFDASIALEVLAGHDFNDATSRKCEPVCYSKNIGNFNKNYRLATIKEIDEAITDQHILKAYRDLLNQIKGLGVVVEEVSLSKKLLETLFPTYFVISCAEATSNNANLDGIKFGPYYDGKTYQEVMMNARTKGFSELIKRRFVFGSYALMKENQNDLFIRAKRNRKRIIQEINKIFAKYDFIISLASSGVAPTFDNNQLDKLSDEYLIAENHLVIGNFAGLPSITLPLGFEDNLPFGVNLSGKPFYDQDVLIMAKKIEELTGLENISSKRCQK